MVPRAPRTSAVPCPFVPTRPITCVDEAPAGRKVHMLLSAGWSRSTIPTAVPRAIICVQLLRGVTNATSCLIEDDYTWKRPSRRVLQTVAQFDSTKGAYTDLHQRSVDIDGQARYL